MTTRDRKLSKSIIPSTYKQPKYRFGQMVKQGRIIGMEYYPPDLVKIDVETEEWSYWVLEDEETESLYMLTESEIEPLTSEELQVLVNDEIEFHQRSIAALREQIKQS